LGRTIFFMDPLKLSFPTLPIFYKNVFKVWNLFIFQKVEDSKSLYWLLEEPLIHGKRLDLTDNCFLPRLNKALVDNKIVTLGRLLEIAGLDFKNKEATSRCLGINSTRVIAQLLQRWESVLNDQERLLLLDYKNKLCYPDSEEHFPGLLFALKLDGCSGVFFFNKLIH